MGKKSRAKGPVTLHDKVISGSIDLMKRRIAAEAYEPAANWLTFIESYIANHRVQIPETRLAEYATAIESARADLVPF